MLLAYHANVWMCITNTVSFILILPVSAESYVRQWVVTKPAVLGHVEEKLLSSILASEEYTAENSAKVETEMHRVWSLPQYFVFSA